MANQVTVKPPPEGAIQNFSQLVGALEEGTLNSNISEKMQALVERLTDEMRIGRAAKGSVSLKVHFSADRGVFDVYATYSVTEPKEARRRSVFWPANGSYLSSRDPNQTAMTIRAVDDGEQPQRRALYVPD